MRGAREERKPKKQPKKGRGGLGAFFVILVLVIGYLGLCFWVNSSDKILPNVSAAGVELSGMTVEQAGEALKQGAAQTGGDLVVTLTCKDWSGELKGSQLEQPWEAIAQEAGRVGRDSFLAGGVQYLTHLLGMGTSSGLVLEGNQPALDQLLQEAAAAVDQEAVEPSARIEGETLIFTQGITGAVVDTKNEDTRLQIMEAFDRLFQGEEGKESVELPVVEDPYQKASSEQIHQELAVEPKDAALSPDTYELMDHVVGVDFDVEALKSVAENTPEGEEDSIPLQLTMPKETRDSLKAKLFRDLLGQATSKVGGTPNRKSNVRLSAQACNGKILLPGEVFSYNGTTGSRSASKGYLPAPVYSGGASVDDVGGGICQTSSTIYSAVLHTTLEVVERRNHMYAVGYVPDGMDATVYYGSTDFRFRNNTDYPVKVVTQSYDKGGNRYLNVKIYGTNTTGRYAVPKNNVFEWIEPVTQYKADPSIPQGTTSVDRKQNPYRGRKASVTRYVYEKDGSLVTKQDMGTSSYKMRPKTILYNPADGDPATWPNGVPPTPVAPTPTPVPTPTPETPAVPETNAGA